MTPKQFVIAVESALVPLSDPALARPMAAYMKDQFDFLGIKTPARRAATKSLIRQQSEDVIDCAEALWVLPHREYHYVACDLLERHAKTLPASALARVVKLATQKSWWDTVDSLAKTAGTIVQNFPELIARMEALATHKNMWLRRTAILHQLGFGSATDTDRLFRLCLLNAADPEFFIRKAIGWALRQTAIMIRPPSANFSSNMERNSQASRFAKLVHISEVETGNLYIAWMRMPLRLWR